MGATALETCPTAEIQNKELFQTETWTGLNIIRSMWWTLHPRSSLSHLTTTYIIKQSVCDEQHMQGSMDLYG